MVKRNSRILYRLPLAMIIIALSSPSSELDLSTLILFFGARSFKLDHSAMLPSPARPSKRSLSAQCFSESIIFQLRNYLQAPTNGAVVALSPYHFRPDYCKVQANAAADALPCRPPRKTFALSRSQASLLRSRTLLSRLQASLSGFYSFGPHPVGSPYFDPVLTTLDPRLRNTRPVLATSVVRRVLKRASRRTYKDNVSGMKLGCRAIERRQPGPGNQDRASWIRRLGRLRWGLL